MIYLDPLRGVLVDPLVLTVASALVSTLRHTQPFVAAQTQLLKAYALIFQTLRAPVTQTRSVDTTRRPNFLVAPRRVFGTDTCAYPTNFEISRDVHSLFRHADCVYRRLSGFSISPIGQISGAIHRQTIQAVDSTFLARSSVCCFKG